MNITLKERAIPCAYFITFTCYGTWLHGDIGTSVDFKHNIPRTEFLAFNGQRLKSVAYRMNEEPYIMNKQRRDIVLFAIKEVCKHRNWSLLAAHIRTNHIHLVVHAIESPEHIMTSIKSYSSRYLNEAGIDTNRINRWTRHGSTQYLWSEPEIEATIYYVVHEQGKPMAVYENINRLYGTTNPRINKSD